MINSARLITGSPVWLIVGIGIGVLFGPGFAGRLGVQASGGTTDPQVIVARGEGGVVRLDGAEGKLEVRDDTGRGVRISASDAQRCYSELASKQQQGAGIAFFDGEGVVFASAGLEKETDTFFLSSKAAEIQVREGVIAASVKFLGTGASHAFQVDEKGLSVSNRETGDLELVWRWSQ